VDTGSIGHCTAEEAVEVGKPSSWAEVRFLYLTRAGNVGKGRDQQVIQERAWVGPAYACRTWSEVGNRLGAWEVMGMAEDIHELAVKV
jgi:hypothetical protein